MPSQALARRDAIRRDALRRDATRRARTHDGDPMSWLKPCGLSMHCCRELSAHRTGTWTDSGRIVDG